MPRTPRWARTLVASLAITAVTLSLLASPPEPAHAGSHSPGTVDPSGDIPCITATPAVFAALECRGKVINRYDLPSSVVPPVYGTNASYNCHPTRPLPTASVFGGVEMAATYATAVSRGSQTSVTHSYAFSWSLDKKPGGVGAGFTFTHTHAFGKVESLDETEERAATTAYSIRETQAMSIPAYHWGLLAFKPQYSISEVLWTWKEPALTAENDLARAAGIQYLKIPKERPGNPYQAGSPVVPMGTWIPLTIPMTPAEIDACAAGRVPDAPVQSVFADLFAPSGTNSLVSLPAVRETVPAQSPVLRGLAGTPQRLIATPALAVGFDPAKTVRAPRGTVTLDTTEPLSMQLTGNSELVYWIGGNCSALRTTVGYGQNMLVSAPGVARDRVQISIGSEQNGQVVPGALLVDELVPAASPDRISGKGDLQKHLDVPIPADARFLIISVVATEGSRDTSSAVLPGVLFARPTLDCAQAPDPHKILLRSSYSDPITPVTVDMAGTPEEVAADPTRFAQPRSVKNGPTCQNEQGPSGEKLMLPAMNVACWTGPLTVAGTTYSSGVGVHSDATVTWDIPANCFGVTFGVGLDGYFEGNRFTATGGVVSSTQRVSVAVAPYADNRELGAWKTIQPGITLTGSGSSGVQWFESKELGLGPRQLSISIKADSGNIDQALINIVNPEFHCQHQGPTVSSYTPITRPDTVAGVVDVATMPWLRASGFWGPVERNRSLGEQPAGDGRPVSEPLGGPVMSVGGISGWSSGIGTAPPAWKQGESQVEVATQGATCTRFTAWVGIDDEVGTSGSAQFIVYADGKPVATSPVLRGGQAPHFITADVTNAVHVMLAVNNGGDSNAADHADWLEPRLFCEESLTALTSTPISRMNWSAPGISYWGPVERDMSLGEQPAGDGRPISLGAMTGWATGLGMAPGARPGEDASVSLAVNGSCSVVTSWVGVDDEVRQDWDNWRGSVVFEIWADGHKVAESPKMVSGDQPHFLSAFVGGAQSVRLVATNAGDGNSWDHASWADPTIHCG